MSIPEAFADDFHRLVTEAILHTNVGIFDWDLEADSIQHSATLKTVLGYGDDEQPSKAWHEHIPESERYQAMHAMRESITNGKTKYDGVHRIIDHHGASRWVVVKASVLRDRKGEAKRFVGALIDVTNLQKDRN